MTNSIRTLIVDDEPLALDSLRTLLDQDEDIALIGECADGPSALHAIRELQPDLVFLDIQMPMMSGMEVLYRLEEQEMPIVVFVTAFDQYAVRAFELNALDYVLKPFDDGRFRQALGRAKTRMAEKRSGRYSRSLLKLLAGHSAADADGSGVPKRIAIRSTGRIQFVDVDSIDWIRGSGNYAELHVGSKTHLHRETLNSLESRLPPRNFVRIHRSVIVNIGRVTELRPHARGDYRVLMQDGTEVNMSRSHRHKLDMLVDSG